MAMAGLLATLLVALLIIDPFCLATPQAILWSSNTYGPDGPWQAVKVQIGTPPQPIDLIPGGTFASNILTSTICENATLSPVCYAMGAGMYNASASSSHVHSGATGHVENGPFDSVIGALPVFGTFEFGFDSAQILSSTSASAYVDFVGSFDMIQISEGHETLPDGTPYPLTIGKLGLGAADQNQTWAQGGGLPNLNGTFLPSYLFSQGLVSSNSYGMHIGSASLGIPGSLLIGGYDQSRVIGPVSTQDYGNYFLPIEMLDIGYGVAEGQSPLSFDSKSGYLAHGNTSIGNSIAVQVDASLPYMYLPQSTCDAIAQDLPVSFQPKYGLYFWNTSDPRYSLASSPSYLDFSFRLNGGNTGNLTINVPFALLNLTLTPPLTNTPTQYFPCRPTNGTYILGRAFLQAAFVSVNWGTKGKGSWFLAQAPGPNTDSLATITEIGTEDTSISSSNNDWLKSWQGSWKAIAQIAGNTSSSTATATASTTQLGSATGTPTSASPSSTQAFQSTSTGLSTGAVAGISVGAGLAGLAAVGLCVLLWRKSLRTKLKHPKASSPAFGQDFYDSPITRQKYGSGGWGPRELNHEREPVEIGSRALVREPVEMG